MSDTAQDMDPRAFVERFPALTELSVADARILLREMQRLDLPAGKEVIARGDLNDSIYFIWGGGVSVGLTTGEAVLTVGEFTAGQWIGETSLVDPAPASAACTTLADSTLLSMSHARFMDLRRSHPAITSTLLQMLNESLAERMRRTVRFLDRGPDASGLGDQDQRHWLLEALRRVIGTAARSAT
jgi:CRP-like cAMP-binding protein